MEATDTSVENIEGVYCRLMKKKAVALLDGNFRENFDVRVGKTMMKKLDGKFVQIKKSSYLCSVKEGMLIYNETFPKKWGISSSG